jgi:hypothetical protein
MRLPRTANSERIATSAFFRATFVGWLRRPIEAAGAGAAAQQMSPRTARDRMPAPGNTVNNKLMPVPSNYGSLQLQINVCPVNKKRKSDTGWISGPARRTS